MDIKAVSYIRTVIAWGAACSNCCREQPVLINVRDNRTRSILSLCRVCWNDANEGYTTATKP